jgi:PTS system nitrogen regulatory IIA component
MAIFHALMDREASGSTGLGLGVAMPHARFKELRVPFALFARLGRPIEFHALDGRLVDMIFLLLGPDPATSTYLKLLIATSHALRESVIRERLRDCFDANLIVAALKTGPYPLPFDRAPGSMT